MHDTALEIGKAFFSDYWQAGYSSILDISSMNVNGSLRDCAPKSAKYVGVDVAKGSGVDVIVSGAAALPFPDQHFDVIVSTSCFEHDAAFWMTFLEMLRVLKSGGHVFINAPSNGEYHTYPLDCWRFYPDSGVALEKWAIHSKLPVVLVESFTAGRLRAQWNDFIMVFRRGDSTKLPIRFLGDMIQRTYNVRRIGQSVVANRSARTEDQLIIAELIQRLAASRQTSGGGAPGIQPLT